MGAAVTFNPVTWVNNGPVTLGSTSWQALSAYLVGQVVLDSNGNIQTAQAPGVSAAAEPAWSTNPGDVTQDGTLKWTNGGLGKWQPNHAYKAGQFSLARAHRLAGLNKGVRQAGSLAMWMQWTGLS
jgi:hypothetical protein